MDYKVENWTEGKGYQFKLKDAKFPEVDLPGGYTFREGYPNEMTRRDFEEFKRIYGGKSPGRDSIFYQKVGEGNNFFMLWVYFEKRVVGSSLVIIEPKTGSCRIEWSNVLPKHRKKGLYRNMQYHSLKRLEEMKVETLRFGLSEAWLLPFWLSIFGKKKTITFTQFSSLFREYKPMTRKEEIWELVKIIEKRRPKIIMEIGVGSGGTFKLWETIIPINGMLIGIDIMDESKWDHRGSKKRVHFLHGNSLSKKILNKAKGILNGEKIDFLFIDGCHEGSIVRQDFSNYRQLVKENGVVAFHDIRAPDTKDYQRTTTVDKVYTDLKGIYKSQDILPEKGWKGSDGIGIIFLEKEAKKGMNIVITGASSGIGRATAREFSRQYPDSAFLLTYRKAVHQIVRVRAEIEGQGSNVMVGQLDVTTRKDVKKIIEYFVKQYGKIDILVNNAGINIPSTVEKMTDEQWDRVIEVNLTGVVNVTRACLPHIESGGAIVNLGSVQGIVGGYGSANYSASKGGVLALGKALAKEVASRGIRVNNVAPGYIDTDLVREIPKRIQEKLRERTLLKRFGTAEEIAKFIVFLAVEGTFCTGQTYIVDGGNIS